MSQYPTITHVIFDVDGLLLDTESIYTRVLSKLAAPYGKEFTMELKLKMMGRKEHEAAQVFIDYLQVPMTVEEYITKLKELIEKEFLDSELMPGAEKLIRHLHNHNVPMSLATGSDSHFFALKTHKHQDLFSVFTNRVFSSEDPDVKHGKPAPDIFLVAAARFQPPPQAQHVLVFEDAPNGVAAGLAAGMPTIWVPDPLVDRDTIALAPTQTLTALTDFQPHLYGLPAYT